MPKVSFVMPNRNKEAYLSDSIQSVLNQTLEDIELIIVDNNSTDNSVKIITDYMEKDSRIILYSHNLPDDMHVAVRIDDARNFGNEQANSDIICVQDSDDISFPERAELTYKAFQENPDCGLFYGTFLQRDKNMEIDRTLFERFISSEFSKNILKKSGLFFIGHLTCAYKKNVILKYPYNSDDIGVGDWGMFYRLLIRNKIKYCFTEEPLCVYRVMGTAFKELADNNNYDKNKTDYLWNKKKKKMELLGDL